MAKLTQAERYYIALEVLVDATANASKKQRVGDSDGSFKEVLRDIHGYIGSVIETL